MIVWFLLGFCAFWLIVFMVSMVRIYIKFWRELK